MDRTKLVQASGWLMETLLTMTLVFVVFAATDSNRAKISTHLPVSGCTNCRDCAKSQAEGICMTVCRQRFPTAHHTTAVFVWDDMMCRFSRLWLSVWQCSLLTW